MDSSHRNGRKLAGLALAAIGGRGRLHYSLLPIGVFGAALFYGDSVITPAISVLSAVDSRSSTDWA